MHKERVAALKSEHKEQLHALRARNRNLQKAFTCSADLKAKAYKRGFEEGRKSKILCLKKKGSYTPRARSLARTLISAGCAIKHVGRVIHAVCAAAGVPVKGNISGRTAARAVIEGGIAAKIQIGYDLGQAKAFTASGDGTSNKHIPYDSHFVHIKSPAYSDPSGPAHRSRFLGVTSTPDQTAEAEAAEVTGQLDEYMQLYNRTPLAARSGKFESFVVLLAKLKGIMTDHCSKARLWAEIMRGRTNDAQNQLPGEEQTLELSEAVIDAAFELSWAKMIQEAGGQAAWSCLPKAEQNFLQAIATKAALISLGEDKYQALSADEQRSLDFFIWVGCGCHKDLNSVSGGYAAMLAWFIDHDDVLGPILLPHKSNTGVIARIRDPHRLNDDQQDAVQTSASGAVRAAWIAGALFNNKDDKKGQQDTFNWWFEKELGLHLSFPDTSNTQYGSYCAACAVLLQYRLQFIRFLEFIKLSKKSTTWTNMECNLLNALTDPPTLSQMAVMALYAQVITHPYICAVRGPAAKDINMLNLGPLHHKIEAHMESIIANPQLVLGPDADYHTAAADGLEWDNPQVVEIILADTSLFPHLEDLLVAFFRGSLQTWRRFTTEFTPGGLIDEATDIEKDLAWLPPTNDLNEGILGSFRQFMRFNPSTTLLMFNSQTMFERNDTQTFIDAKFDAEDHRMVMKIAREVDGSGLEQKQKIQFIEHYEQKNQEKVDRADERSRKKQEKRAHIAGVLLIFDEEKIQGLKGKALEEQIEAYRCAGAPLPPAKKELRLVGDKKAALIECSKKMKDGIWQPGVGGQGDCGEQTEPEMENDLDSDEN
ncbi:hypothetical protein FIBSPDRAFT_747504 [Athelia psychrophila]|uniref:Uncharacterized protein n=1 Tax=Athelia psychrophila TaxID=1759441 RepID=A0A166FU85_9AGAM|nr:hypothetical protein FIBSPDRAFT_747504 [Fibularhizoctonia sp. CBS 109695]